MKKIVMQDEWMNEWTEWKSEIHVKAKHTHSKWFQYEHFSSELNDRNLLKLIEK